MEYVVWVRAEERLASFHPQPGFLPRRFHGREHFLRYLRRLVAQHYRFL